jgi:hypothetical protein
VVCGIRSGINREMVDIVVPFEQRGWGFPLIPTRRKMNTVPIRLLKNKHYRASQTMLFTYPSGFEVTSTRLSIRRTLISRLQFRILHDEPPVFRMGKHYERSVDVKRSYPHDPSLRELFSRYLHKGFNKHVSTLSSPDLLGRVVNRNDGRALTNPLAGDFEKRSHHRAHTKFITAAKAAVDGRSPKRLTLFR